MRRERESGTPHRRKEREREREREREQKLTGPYCALYKLGNTEKVNIFLKARIKRGKSRGWGHHRDSYGFLVEFKS